ncbi:ATP-binding protein [Candidatus Halobeggiatoa sp. HSG11]|nr:ATP-binding protein [Candidatus Halobeggiatoa sp. HSG11]
MKINTLSYKNTSTGWELKPISFDNLTLLVGASGVGKTRILKSILDLKKISKGESLNGVKWFIDFSTKNGNKYQWEGEFENDGFDLNIEDIIFIPEIDDKDKAKIKTEKLHINNEIIIDRNIDGIIFNGTKTVKLSQNESIISLLKEEEQLKDIYTEFSRIIFDNNIENTSLSRKDLGIIDEKEVEFKLSEYNTLQKIRESNEDMLIKLYLFSINQQNIFNSILEAFTDIFPYIEDVKIAPIESKYIHHFLRDVLFIKIKEKGVTNWIYGTKISSGMLRTLLHIAELYLCADSSVILIDEFENSLGINCIDEITSSIVSAERDLQFIITSHHPYIINNINYSHWKLVTRKAGAVVARDVSEFGFDKSKHKAFTQLMNLDLYSEGVET